MIFIERVEKGKVNVSTVVVDDDQVDGVFGLGNAIDGLSGEIDMKIVFEIDGNRDS